MLTEFGPTESSETNGGQFDHMENGAEVIYSSYDQSRNLGEQPEEARLSSACKSSVWSQDIFTSNAENQRKDKAVFGEFHFVSAEFE